MAEREGYQYAVWRVVPSVVRGECVNAGVVLFCRRGRFLDARIAVDESRWRALDPDVDVEAVRGALEHRVAVARGEPAGGAVATMEPSERFGWLVAPASTVVQPGAVHTGLCEDAAATLDRLFAELVA